MYRVSLEIGSCISTALRLMLFGVATVFRCCDFPIVTVWVCLQWKIWETGRILNVGQSLCVLKTLYKCNTTKWNRFFCRGLCIKLGLYASVYKGLFRRYLIMNYRKVFIYCQLLIKNTAKVSKWLGSKSFC